MHEYEEGCMSWIHAWKQIKRMTISLCCCKHEPFPTLLSGGTIVQWSVQRTYLPQIHTESPSSLLQCWIPSGRARNICARSSETVRPAHRQCPRRQGVSIKAFVTAAPACARCRYINIRTDIYIYIYIYAHSEITNGMWALASLCSQTVTA